MAYIDPAVVDHIKILEDAKIIYKVDENEQKISENGRKVITYSLDGEQLKNVLKKLWDTFFPNDPTIFIIKYISVLESLIPPHKRMDISKKFMNTIASNGKMDICFPAESAKFIVTSPIYVQGYQEMKKRGILIRVITEVTKDNFEFLNKMMQNKMVDEVRILKKISCGMALSENQYMSAFLNKEFIYNPKKRFFDTAIYHTEKEIIKLNQSIFDTLWENAIPIFKK